MPDKKPSLAQLQKQYDKKKSAFEDAFADGEPYQVLDQLYHDLKALQIELILRNQIANSKDATR